VKKPVILALLLALPLAFLFPQTYSTGAILDEAIYSGLPQKATQVTRSYTFLPPSASIKPYAPLPGDQGQYGTCVGWSTTYAARTILESLALDRSDRRSTTGEVFSPIFTYKNISTDPSGQKGTFISDALNFMQKQGAVKRASREVQLDFKDINLEMYTASRRYPIAGYTTLYPYSQGNTADISERVRKIKKSLAERKPVIIGMNCPNSFFKTKGVWQPEESSAASYGGHAMCVVGYDDSQYGGAFEVQNSWGERWGNAGYIWIPYDVLGRFAFEAYELIENMAAYETIEYAGSVAIELFISKQGMPVRFQNGYYQTTAAYTSGTRFRYLMGNTKPAYVYAFSADEATTTTNQIFPPEEGNISPVLDYKDNVVAIPGEYQGNVQWIRMDDTTGTDYLVVLFAKQELDLNAIRSRFAKAQGAFPDRVAQAVGSDFIPPQKANYELTDMKFSAKSTNPKAVFGLLLAITHQ
jgi:hypothetical protein